MIGKAQAAGWAIGAAALILGAGLSVPASAGPLAELECATAGLSDTQANALVARVGEGRGAGKPDVRAAADVIAACTRRFEWTREEVLAASHFLPAFAAQRRFRAHLQGQNVDLAAIEREIAGDAALVAAAAALRNNPPELSAFLTRYGPSLREWQARHGDDRASLQALGGFIAATAVVEGMRQRFSAD